MDSRPANGVANATTATATAIISTNPFRSNGESFLLEDITHFSRSEPQAPPQPMVHGHNYSTGPTNSLISVNMNGAGVGATRHSSEDYSSEPLSVGGGGVGASTLARAAATRNAASATLGGIQIQRSHSGEDSDSYRHAFASSSSEDDDEVTQYHRYDKITAKPSTSRSTSKAAAAGSSTSNGTGIPSQNIIRPAISDDNFPTILNSNAVVSKSDVTFALITLLVTALNFGTDATLVFWHYANGHAWYSAMTAIIMMLGACAMLHQFGIIDMERLRRIFDDAKRVRIATNCLPTCGTIISSYYLTKTGLKAKTNQMFALQFFSHEEFLQNLLRIQSVFQAAPQATLQLLVFMETGHEMSFAKGVFLFVNIVASLTVMTIGNMPARARSEEFDSTLSPGAYNLTATTRLFIGLRMFSSFASRIMGIVYALIGINCVLGKFSTVATFESFLISFSIILIPRFCFTFADYCNRRLRGGGGGGGRNSVNNTNLSCCRVFLGYLATIFFPMSDPLWIFWYIWFETILFTLFGNVVGWFNATECVSNLVNAIYTGTFVVLFIVIPIFLPFARATVKKRQLRRLENIFERGTRTATATETCEGSRPGSTQNGGRGHGRGYRSKAQAETQLPETSFSVMATNETEVPNSHVLIV